MSRRNRLHLTDPEIGALERLDDGALTAELVPTGKAGQVVRALVSSYRITARVANAGWAVLQKVMGDPRLMAAVQANYRLLEAVQLLQASLNDYSPGNWPPSRTEREYAARILEQLYEEAQLGPDKDAVLEKIYQAACQAHEGLE